MTIVADLVGPAAVGDRAWNDVVRRYGGMLTAIAAQYRLGSGDGDDAVQMTWLALLRNAHNLREPDRIAAWLATVMRRNCLQLLRRRQYELVNSDWAGWAVTDNHDAPDDDLVRAERDRLLWENVDRLPPRQRDLVRALFDAELSYDDVSRRMSIPVGAIGPTRQRALRRLERLLSRAGMARTA
jgi:RNA polymerase sigma factor (sigma-70 family)